MEVPTVFITKNQQQLRQISQNEMEQIDRRDRGNPTPRVIFSLVPSKDDPVLEEILICRF